MKDPDELPPKDILQKMPDGMDLLHSQAIGKIIIDEFEHDPFIDDLPKTPYPEDAP